MTLGWSQLPWPGNFGGRGQVVPAEEKIFAAQPNHYQNFVWECILSRGKKSLLSPFTGQAVRIKT